METLRHSISDVAAIRSFMNADRPYFTIQSKTGTRFTYRIQKGKFVSLLRGPDNNSDYQYIGLWTGTTLVHTTGSKVEKTAKSFLALEWFCRQLKNGVLPESVTFWHEGRCCRCGRRLTVPESIASGWGPECVKLVQPVKVKIQVVPANDNTIGQLPLL